MYKVVMQRALRRFAITRAIYNHFIISKIGKISAFNVSPPPCVLFGGNLAYVASPSVYIFSERYLPFIISPLPYIFNAGKLSLKPSVTSNYSEAGDPAHKVSRLLFILNVTKTCPNPMYSSIS